LVCAVLPQHRENDGAVNPSTVKPITARGVVDAFKDTSRAMGTRTVERGLNELLELGLLRLIVAGSGRRPSSYLPAGAAWVRLPPNLGRRK
jgi:hypothetical protein